MKKVLFKKLKAQKSIIYNIFEDNGEKPTCNMEWCLTCGLTGDTFTCTSSCEPTLRGCGWFLTQECTKICN